MLLILQRYIKIGTKCNSAEQHRLEEGEVKKPSPLSRTSLLSPDTKVAALLTHPRYVDLGASRQKEWRGTMRTTRLPGSRGSESGRGNVGCGGHKPDSAGRKAGWPQPLMAGPTCLLVPASSTLAACRQTSPGIHRRAGISEFGATIVAANSPRGLGGKPRQSAPMASRLGPLG